jgi:hypothetical protein
MFVLFIIDYINLFLILYFFTVHIIIDKTSAFYLFITQNILSNSDLNIISDNSFRQKYAAKVETFL